MSDLNFSGYFVFSLGVHSINDTTIRVTQAESPADYQVIKDWVAQISGPLRVAVGYQENSGLTLVERSSKEFANIKNE